jgi:hypothetical protein
MPQAMAGYRFATEALRDELRQVELAIRNVDKMQWLDRLKSHNKTSTIDRDPMAANTSYHADAGPEMPYLYRLFASHDFAEQFRQYMELDRLRSLLLDWQQSVPALEKTWNHQLVQLEAVLPNARARLINLKRQQQQIGVLAADISVNMPQRIDMRRPQDLANFDQLLSWELISALESQFRNLAPAQRERIRRTKGVLLYNIASAATENREQQIQTVSQSNADIDIAGLRIEAAEQLVRDASLHVRSDLGKRLNARRQDIDKMINSTEALMAQLGQILKNDALRVLAQNRIQLGEQLAEAHLAMARVQDTSFSERLRGTAQ